MTEHASRDHRVPQNRALQILLPLAVLAAGTVIVVVLALSAPRAAQREEVRMPRIVKTVEARPGTETISVSAYGTVIPAREVTIEPQVRGLVVNQHPALVPGGFISAGEKLIDIDRAEYELALVEQESALAEAEYELALERGRQVVASREWTLLEGDLPESEANRSLVLREPHLKRTEALIRKAQNEIAKAQLDLARTSVIAPFNSMVLEESVEKGQLVERGTSIATLVGTDEFWVRVSVPLQKLPWITLPGEGRPGARARVFLETGNGASVEREGHVVRLIGDLEPDGRLARLLVSVEDPLGLHGKPATVPLLLGSYVRVAIDAGELHDVVAVSRAAIREGDRIWLVNSANRLKIRPVNVLWTRQNSVLIENCIEADERLVVSGLRMALPEMEVRPQPADSEAHTESDTESDAEADAQADSDEGERKVSRSDGP